MTAPWPSLLAYDRELGETVAEVERTGDPRGLERAVARAQQLLLAASDFRARTHASVVLATMLLRRAQETGRAPDRTAAARLLREIRASGALDPTTDAVARLTLCGAIVDGEPGRDLEDTDLEVLALTEGGMTGDPDAQASAANYRGAVLARRYVTSGRVDDITRALRHLRAARALATDPRLAVAVAGNLATALTAEYTRTADHDVLAETLELTEDIVDTLAARDVEPAGDAFGARGLCARGVVLSMVWQFERDIEAADEAAAIFNHLLNGLPAESPILGEVLMASGSLWHDIGIDVDDESMLAEAATRLVAASEQPTMGRLHRRAALTGAATALLARSELVADALDDIDHALELLAEARDESDGPELVATFDHNVAVGMFDRYLETRAVEDLDAAVTWHERSLAGARREGPDYDTAQIRASMAHFARHRERGEAADLARATQLLEDAARRPRTTLGRLAAAKQLADVAASVGDWAMCATAGELAVEALDAALGGLDLPHWEDWLRRIEGVATLGAYAAARRGEALRAIALVERGCAVLAAGRLEQQQAALRFARADGHGALVDRYESALEHAHRTMVRAPRGGGAGLIDPDGHELGAQAEIAASDLTAMRQRLAAAVPSLASGATAAELVEFVTATGAGLTYLLATTHGGMALHLRAPAVAGAPARADCTEIAALSVATVEQLAVSLHLPDEAEPVTPGPVRGPSRGPDAGEVFAVVDWLELALADAIAASGPDACLVTVGTVGLLPVQAAWRTPQGRSQATGAAASGLLHLAARRNAARLAGATGVAAVTNPQPCHWSGRPMEDLFCADDEGAFLAERFGATVLNRERATAAGTRALFEREQAVLHLSTHGWTSAEDPDSVRLLLADGAERHAESLTISDLPDRLASRTVFLAGCWLAQTDFRLPEEAIGFPTTLVQTGAAAVLAPLWPVDDYATSCFVHAFYEALLGAGASPRVAVASARDALRRRADDDPDLLPAERARLRATVDAFVLTGH